MPLECSALAGAFLDECVPCDDECAGDDSWQFMRWRNANSCVPVITAGTQACLGGMLEAREMPALTAVCALAACSRATLVFGPLDGFLDGFKPAG
jgi:hypothetical protein